MNMFYRVIFILESLWKRMSAMSLCPKSRFRTFWKSAGMPFIAISHGVSIEWGHDDEILPYCIRSFYLRWFWSLSQHSMIAGWSSTHFVSDVFDHIHHRDHWPVYNGDRPFLSLQIWRRSTRRRNSDHVQETLLIRRMSPINKSSHSIAVCHQWEYYT